MIGPLADPVEPTEWARRLLAAVDGPVPAYGSPAWEALPDTDRRKAAAAVQAAEAYRQLVPALAAAVDVIAGLDEELRSRDAATAEAAADLDERVRRTVDQTAARLVAPPAPMPEARPVVQTVDWPTVAVPPAAARPAPLQMLARLAAPRPTP